MARIVLVTGGARSGKSTYARRVGEALAGPRALVATCPLIDDQEMLSRIRKHRSERDPRHWDTLEEPLALGRVLREAGDYRVLLVDCLTLWVNNLMYEAEKKGGEVSEEEMEERCRDLLAACADRRGTVIFVTNEVGMGIVPENALARRFRDLAGRCNQVMAAGADEVTLMVSGIPLRLKGGPPVGGVVGDHP